MAVDIAAEVTRTWPTTEGVLSAAGSGVDYAGEKARALDRAKRTLYTTRPVPAEDDIPETAAYWIADQAVVFLIPLAIDYYMNKQRLSDAKDGATVQYYDKTRQLRELRRELEVSLAANRQAALNALDDTVDEEDVPTVSTAGMAVDPLFRAMQRGPAPR
jgi:hypothetical protein